MSRKFFAWLKKDWILKILSVFFAFILWMYVMAVENPQVDKPLTNVPVRFAAEDELLARNLIVRGDRSTLLPKVGVILSIERSYYSSVTSDALNATLGLSGIVSPGTYTLRINTTTPRGKIISTTPPDVTLEIDRLTTKTVPLRLEMQGELPKGFWAGKPELTPAAVQITGALTDIERVRQGVCIIDLSGMTRGYNDTLRVELRDENNELVENTILLGDQPSTILKMDVLPKKTVGFDLESAIIDSDKLPRGFEINTKTTMPTTIEVVGEASVLEGLTKLAIEPFSVGNATESILKSVKIKVPEGVTLLGESEVDVIVDIVEQTHTENFAAVPVDVVGLGKGLTATLSELYADVTATGRISLMDQLARADIGLDVDVTGLPEGEHLLDIKPKIAKKDMHDVTLTTVPSQILVTIRKK